MEETVSGLCQLAAAAWVARGETKTAPATASLTTSRQITLELKNGDKAVR